ncbi:Variant surface glycoprotein [Trypanosoma congolense IL3000]|uniref:Variant surface glycoprotein n=1 Tax=Trypanosoma congolense (strain IL3000) TaxID=1068625 RepID=F9WAW1_TRYCI|nr:Variant surface glycoprotein [Trypanosoma congolense IL3000]
MDDELVFRFLNFLSVLIGERQWSRMCIVKYLVSVFIVVVVVRADGAEETSVKKDHNKDEHSVLCDLLNAAVFKWKEIENSDSPLKKALAKTIFGNESGGNLEHLRSLPVDYDELKSRTLPRYYWCGERNQGGGSSGSNPPRRSGHSAPHDLICLCTPGDDGYPVNGSAVTNDMLCGKGAKELEVESDKKGWGIIGQGEKQIKATWEKVVTECLHGSGKGTRLKDALDNFIKKLGPLAQAIHSYQSLGKGNFSSEYSCSGKGIYGVCVKYYPEEKHALPWWKELKKAIEVDEKEQKKHEEAEKRKQEAQKQRQPQKQDQSQYPQGPRTAALRSTMPSSEETEQSSTENISNPLATLEDTSGTIIAQPCPWLLSSILLI